MIQEIQETQEAYQIGLIGSLAYIPYGDGLKILGRELYSNRFYIISAFSDVGVLDKAINLIMQGYREAYREQGVIDIPYSGGFILYSTPNYEYMLSNIEFFFRFNNGMNGVILFGGNLGVEIAARYIYINQIPAVALTCFGGAAQQIPEKHFDPYRRGRVITGVDKLENIVEILKNKIKAVKKNGQQQI